MKLHDLKQQRAKHLTDANELVKKAETETRDLTEEENEKINELATQAESLGEQIATRERLERLASVVDANGNARGAPLPHEDPHETRNGQHRYSLMKAIRQQISFRVGGSDRLDGLELEVHQELSKRSTRPPQGILVPWTLGGERRAELYDAERERRALDTTAGTGSIAQILSTDLIDLLRNKMVVQAAGATVLSDLTGGTFAIPRQSAAATMQWVAEATAPAPSQQTIDQVAFTPRTAGAFTDYTRRFFELTNQSAEAFVRNDLMAVVARGVDLASFSGTGAPQPTGIVNVAAIPTVALGTNGTDPTWAMIVGLESLVAVANADIGNLSYIVNAKTRGKMKATPKIAASTFPIYLWNTESAGTPLNGYPAFVTNQLRSSLTKGTSSGVCSEMIFGNWSDLILAFWSGLDVLVDPYTGSSSGNVRIVCLQDMDINVRHKESFAVCNDVLTV